MFTLPPPAHPAGGGPTPTPNPAPDAPTGPMPACRRVCPPRPKDRPRHAPESDPPGIESPHSPLHPQSPTGLEPGERPTVTVTVISPRSWLPLLTLSVALVA